MRRSPCKWPAWVERQLSPRQLQFLKRVAQAEPRGLFLPVNQRRNRRTLHSLEKRRLVEFWGGHWHLVTDPENKLVQAAQAEARRYHPEDEEIPESYRDYAP